MTMFRALAPALTVWAANPRALRVVLLDKEGEPQDLTGRTATLAFRRSTMLEPRVTVEAVLAADGYAWLFLLAADQCDLLYADRQSYSLSYDVIETYAGGSLRWTGRVDTQPASELPGGGADPVLVDLPVAELVSESDTILVSERGAQGFGAEKRLYDAGLIDEPTTQKMDERYLQAGNAAAEAADAVRIATDAVRVQTEIARDGAQEVVDAAPAVIEARDVAVAAKGVAVGAARKTYSAPYFYMPGTTILAEAAVIGDDDRPREISLADGSRYQPDASGLWSVILTSTGIRAITAALPAAALMFYVPGTAEVAVTATRYADGGLQSVTGDGSATGVATQLIASPDGMVAVGAQASVAEPATIEAEGGTITVPGGSIAMPGDRTISWAASVVTPGDTTTDAGIVKSVPGPASTATWLDHDEIVAASVIRTSDSVAMTEGTHYTLDRARGVITNLTANAMTLTYSGSRGRKDVLSVNPNTSALTLTAGTESKRNADDWSPALPSGAVEVGRVLRKGARTIFIPRHRWRNGVHVDRKAAWLAALEYNRQILAPIIGRLKAGQRVRIIGAGNSWGAMGQAGTAAMLNVNYNSLYNANVSLRYGRDLPNGMNGVPGDMGYFELYDDATLALHGLDDASLVSWSKDDVGYNLTPGGGDGFGARHGRAGYSWAMIDELHRIWPNAVIEYHNWSVAGTNSGTGALGNGAMNLLNPTRRDAILADIVAGETLVIPVDPMNELGSSASYGNWRSFASLAQAAGAVVHFMGAARPDPRVGAGADAVALSVQDMCRAAWDSGSAISDAWRILSPANLCGIGLHDEEMMAANLINHGSVRLMREIGRDAAQSYIGA